MSMRIQLLAVPLAVLFLTGCDEKFLVIESNTSWEGEVIPGGSISGEGNAEVDLTDQPSDVCWTLRKTTSAGVLRAYLRDETWFGLGEEFDGDQTTSAPGGEIGGCNQ